MNYLSAMHKIIIYIKGTIISSKKATAIMANNVMDYCTILNGVSKI